MHVNLLLHRRVRDAKALKPSADYSRTKGEGTMKGEYQKLSERPIAEILRDERSKEAFGKGKDEDSKKKPRWRDSALPTIERPFRARKAIERFGSGPEKDSPRAEKELQILKGSGTALKDIPNVVYKLAKLSKADDILVLLHTLLYGKRTKVNYLKSNILSFSGYVWDENKEKERKKVRERLERFTREGLYQLIDLLDVQISKSASKKEELVEEVFKFLLAPKITRDITLEKQEQKSKEEPSKAREKKGKHKKGAEKSDQKKDNYAVKREKRGKTAIAEDNVAKEDEQYFGKKRRRSKSQKGIVEEVQKPSKKAKKSLDTVKQKEDQHVVLKKKDEKDELADDEELLNEEEQTKEQTDMHTKQDGSSKGGDASEENVITGPLAIDGAEVERAKEGTDKEAPKDESGGNDEKAVAENDLFKEAATISIEEDIESTDKNLLLNTAEKEHVPECSHSREEEIKTEESSFIASVQEYEKETEKSYLGYFGENENAEVVEQPDDERELEGKDVGILVPEYVEVMQKVSQPSEDERIYREIKADLVEDAIEGDVNSLAKSEVNASDNNHVD
ncbi:hypothetical protein O6H91_06G107900 [Diphasiastrum complanatum]|uniref:Uncharacterized protein n=5 Tax=Diphasiastrum complanatum TaxID=34168 RepID=A0ACC2DH87_DIPCM|nr:hypothetical protein O6H91_06G107900 [Diphasiastrum complanatum]